MQLILASASPRRREILCNLGLLPTVITSCVNEDIDAPTPEEAVCALSARKAQAVLLLLTDTADASYDAARDVILAADTVVVAPDGSICGKPTDRADAARMLTALQGREHRVISGICVICDGRTVTHAETTFVRFAPMDACAIARLTDSGECDDKAGSYGIQGLASLWIEGIRGDYFNVVGLPVRALERLLSAEFGRSLLHLRQA